MSHRTKLGLSQEMEDGLVQEFEELAMELFHLCADVDRRLIAAWSRLDRLQDVIRTGEYPQGPEGGLKLMESTQL